jgi:translocation and assembly module TamA
MRFKLLPIATLLLVAGVAESADPQPYVVRILPTGNGALNVALRASSQLDSLRSRAPVGPFGLVDRAEQDIGRLQTVLNSFGYYRGTVTITINNQPLDSADLPEQLAALPKSETAQVEIRVDPGVLFHIRKVTVEGDVDAAAIGAMNLPEGSPAVAAQVIAARDRLSNALGEEGHAYEQVEQPIAYLDATQPVVDIGIKADAGPIYHLGPIHVEGLKRANPEFVQRHLAVNTGDLYRPSALDRVRADLLGLGIFAAVSVRLPPQSAAQGGQLPITFSVVEDQLHAVSLGAAYSSDLGASATASWTHRDTFGHAEQLTLSAGVINVGCRSVCDGVGYDTSALLIKPGFLQIDQSLQLGFTALRQYLTAYDQIAAISTANVTRKLSSVWSVGVGVTLAQEQVRQHQYLCPPTGSEKGQVDQTLAPAMTPWCHYTLLGFPVSGRYDSTNLTNPLTEPTHGLRVSLSVTPTHSLFGSAHPTFFILQAIASTYFDLEGLHWSEAGRSIIALRGYAAEAVGAQQFSLPPDQRLYAGGSATVRGYAYQTIGPQFPNGNPMGGTALAAGSLELRQRLHGNFGMAAFVDAGEVTAGAVPFRTSSIDIKGLGEVSDHTAYCTKHGHAISTLQPLISVGYGLGFRYFSPVGPIRFDVAAPANPQACDAPFEVYIGLGEAF